MSHTFRMLRGALLLGALAACGGGSVARSPSPPAGAEVGVTVQPPSIDLAPRGTTTFAASVINAINTAVSWTVSPPGCGAVSSRGAYTAPGSEGTCTVVATSDADTTKFGTATVTVATPPAGRTFNVGPTRTYTTLGAVQGLVGAGDLVLVDGNATYAGGVVLSASGAPGSPITYRGVRINGNRPVISGGTNTVEITGSHVVVEGFDLTGGSSRCLFQHGDDNTLRDSVVHGCTNHGILGADADSGSFLMEYVEVYGSGSGIRYHQIYLATDQARYPSAVFRMQHCYVHDSTGGNSVKSRAGRNELYYNWIEGGTYHELELAGADNTEAGVREDSDVVGNVFRKVGSTFYVARFGSDYGDGVTAQSNGRFRFVNNTVITAADASAVFRLFGGIESLEAHNNVFYAPGAGVNLYRDVEAIWVGGSATIAGSNNWVTTGSTNVPAGWTGTLTGADPGFANLAGNDLAPGTGSPLREAGGSAPAFATHPFANPLFPPACSPPARTVGTSPVARPANGTIDLGAYEAP